MLGEPWDDPRDERPEEDLDDDPDVFDEESVLDDDLEALKMISRRAPAFPGES